MSDVAVGHFGIASRATATRTSKSSSTPWVSIFVGISLTIGLLALKVISLGVKEGWGFLADVQTWSSDWAAWDSVPWHAAEWADIGVYTLEAVIAGAAGSIVFNYAVNNISQTISNIWQQVDLTGSTDPTIMRVEPETRSWLSGLTHDAAHRSAEALRNQEARINELLAEISALKAQNAGLDSDMEARNARLSEAFATIIEQIRLLREDLGRGRP